MELEVLGWLCNKRFFVCLHPFFLLVKPLKFGSVIASYRKDKSVLPEMNTLIYNFFQCTFEPGKSDERTFYFSNRNTEKI